MPRTYHSLALMFSLVVTFLLGGTASARAELLFGLTEGQQLVTFDSDTRTIDSAVALSGLGSDSLLGIDFRPSTGELYGMSTGNRFYKINTGTGAATPVGNAIFMIDIVKSFDFDPVNDNIRVLTNLRKNLVVNPNTGVLSSTDALLNFAAGDPNAGVAPQVVHGAYTNSFAGATSTTLFNLEAATDVLTEQSPQSTGTLNTVGALGLALGTLESFNGMDISGGTGIGYVVGQSLLPGGLLQNTLYTIDLATGAIALAGGIIGTPQAGPLTFGGGHEPPDPWNWGGTKGTGLLIDVATIPAVPEPSTFLLAGLGGLAVVLAARRQVRVRARA